MKSIIDFLRKYLFRGWLARRWILRRARQLDAAYIAALAAEGASNTLTANEIPKALTVSASVLRRILFVGDCMWEKDQLFPEIRKICALDVLDLKRMILGATDAPGAVVMALDDYAKTNKAQNPDLIIFYARPSLLSKDAFEVIRKRWSCPVLGMNLDDRVEFFPYGILRSGNDNYAGWIHSFDLNLTSSLAAVDWYRARGAQVRYLPQGFHPDSRFLHPPEKADFKHSFSFVGSWKPERGELVNQLEALGIRPDLFGSGWKGSQWAKDPQAIFRSSQINLGIGFATASARIANAKGRDIECPATGACYLSTYHWELSNLFEIGKEVLCYRNVEELIEMLTYYKKRPEACLAIAKAAHRRAMSEHTWEARLRGLFKELGFRLDSK